MRLIFILFMFSFFVQAKLAIEITQGQSQPMPVAMIAFEGGTPQAQKMGKEISSIVQSDLSSTGLFTFTDPKAFIQTHVDIDIPPRFGDWRLIKAQALINGDVEILPHNLVRVRFRVWDIYAEEAMIISSLETSGKHWRRIAHLIADAIYKRITGEEGYFDTRLVYIAEEGSPKNRKKRLAIMDQDGANHQYLTDGRYMVLTPRFSPNMQKIAYFSYVYKKPKVFTVDLETGQQSLVGQFPGMTFAPRFSSHGDGIIMSQALGGNSGLYTMDLKTRKVLQLTRGRAIDTSPCYDPTGEKIVFNSDRGGAKQLYVMNADGSNIKRISFGTGTYSTPVWSPRGDLIAFTKTQGGQFYIGVMKPDGTAERLIATGFLVEGPTWAPNGRTLIFTRQERSTKTRIGRSRLYAIDITGHHEREIKTPGDASDPAWSPLLPTA